MTIDRGTKSAAVARFQFRAVPGAVSYRFQMKRALAENLTAMSDEYWSEQTNETGELANQSSVADSVTGDVLPRRRAPGNQRAPGSTLPIHKWQPVVTNSTTSTGHRVLQIDFADLLHGPDENVFYTLWYRNVDGSDRNPRCLTKKDSFSTTEHVSSMLYDKDGCRIREDWDQAKFAEVQGGPLDNASATLVEGSGRHIDNTLGPFSGARGEGAREQSNRTEDIESVACEPGPPCAPFSGQGISDFAFSPFALSPRKPWAMPWPDINNTCSTDGDARATILLFAVACSGIEEDPTCDFLHPSRALLLSIDCSGEHEVLELQKETVSLSPQSCILNGMLQPSAFLCEDRESSGSLWAMHPWALLWT